MTKLEFVCSDEKSVVLLRAARLYDEGVELEPVRHGEWIEDGPDWVCSYCGTEFRDEIEFIKLDYDYYMPHYCPHCGAKMDAEVNGDA